MKSANAKRPANKPNVVIALSAVIRANYDADIQTVHILLN